MRTRVAAVAGVVMVLSLGGCGGSPKASPAPTKQPTTASPTTPAPTSPSVPALSSTPTVASHPQAPVVTIGSIMSVNLPTGWAARRSPINDGWGDVCLAPRSGAKVVVFGCAGIAIWFGAHLPGAEMSAYAPDKENGWYPATDVQECPFVPSGGKFDGIRPSTGFQKGLKPVGSHMAAWNRWSANCDDGKHPFHPQAWYLPKSKVVIFDYLEHPQTAAVLASATFASDGAQLSTYVSGHLVSFSGSKIVVQPFRTYGNNAEGKAWAKAHGHPYPFMDDYFDADFGPKRTFLLNAGTACQGNVNTGKPAEGAPIACSAFSKEIKDTPMGIWVRPGGSTAEAVIEIFRP